MTCVVYPLESEVLISTVNYLGCSIRSWRFQTANDPGGGGLKAPPPLRSQKFLYQFSPYHRLHVHFTRCCRHDVSIGIFQKFAILTMLQRFQNKK